eukprot:967250-Rhodomonas_salina.2
MQRMNSTCVQPPSDNVRAEAQSTLPGRDNVRGAGKKAPVRRPRGGRTGSPAGSLGSGLCVQGFRSGGSPSRAAPWYTVCQRVWYTVCPRVRTPCVSACGKPCVSASYHTKEKKRSRYRVRRRGVVMRLAGRWSSLFRSSCRRASPGARVDCLRQYRTLRSKCLYRTSHSTRVGRCTWFLKSPLLLTSRETREWGRGGREDRELSFSWYKHTQSQCRWESGLQRAGSVLRADGTTRQYQVQLVPQYHSSRTEMVLLKCQYQKRGYGATHAGASITASCQYEKGYTTERTS